MRQRAFRGEYRTFVLFAQKPSGKAAGVCCFVWTFSEGASEGVDLSGCLSAEPPVFVNLR